MTINYSGWPVVTKNYQDVLERRHVRNYCKVRGNNARERLRPQTMKLRTVWWDVERDEDRPPCGRTEALQRLSCLFGNVNSCIKARPIGDRNVVRDYKHGGTVTGPIFTWLARDEMEILSLPRGTLEVLSIIRDVLAQQRRRAIIIQLSAVFNA